MNNMEHGNRSKTGNRGSFKPGQNGNPGGRPKRTEKERDALESTRKLASQVSLKLMELLNGIELPVAVRLEA